MGAQGSTLDIRYILPFCNAGVLYQLENERGVITKGGSQILPGLLQEREGTEEEYF